MDGSLLKGEASRAWAQAVKDLKSGAASVSAARNIDALRASFERLSVGMAGAVDRLGVQVKGPVVELFCSMAFNNRGAMWLQQDEDIRNPYFGAQMLKRREVIFSLMHPRSSLLISGLRRGGCGGARKSIP